MFARRLLRQFPSPRVFPYSSSLMSRFTTALHQHSRPVTRLPAREFPTSGFEVIDASQLIEEERLPFYNREDYYPMKIGAVLEDRYQVVAKLGYGTSSTVWLCHDLSKHSYWALKVHVNTLKYNQEFEVYRHLAGVTMEHFGRDHVRRLEDSFKLKSRNGEHDVFVMQPLGMSLRSLQDLQKDHVFQRNFVIQTVRQLLSGLNFLHEADVIHTDLHSDNLLIKITEDSVLTKVEDDEILKPSARKQVHGMTIYVSRYMLGGGGLLTISDLGQARVGEEHSGRAMPVPYRAPEVILDMKWDNAIDIWSVGLLAWDLLERKSLFCIYDHESEAANDAQHLATMHVLLGPPPLEFWNRSKEASKYWNEDGKWRGPVPLPNETTLQTLCNALEGDEKDCFLDVIQCLLCWLPEERLTAGQAYYHPWLGERS